MVELNNSAILSWGGEYLMPTYSRLPVVFLKGKMQYLWDVENKKYIEIQRASQKSIPEELKA